MKTTVRGVRSVEIEGPGKDVVTPTVNAGVNAQHRDKEEDIPITLLKLKTEKVAMISPTCASTLQ